MKKHMDGNIAEFSHNYQSLVLNKNNLKLYTFNLAFL